MRDMILLLRIRDLCRAGPYARVLSKKVRLFLIPRSKEESQEKEMGWSPKRRRLMSTQGKKPPGIAWRAIHKRSVTKVYRIVKARMQRLR